MRVDMNKTLRRIVACILVVTINTLLFFGGDNYAWAQGIFPDATGSIQTYHEIDATALAPDSNTVYQFIDKHAKIIMDELDMDVSEQEPKDVKDEAITKVVTDLYDNAKDEFIKDVNKAATESIETISQETAEVTRKQAEATANAAYQKVVQNNMDEYAKLSDEAAEYLKQAGDLAADADTWRYAKNISQALQVISKAADVANLVSDVEAITHLNGEKTATKVIEGVAITADMACVLAGLLIPGANIPIAASIAIGVFAQVIHNKKVTDWMDQQFENLENWWDDFTDGLLDWMKLAVGINCYKPNIYIYPQTEMDITVKFQDKEFLTKVIPDYEGIWEVHAKPDGTLYTRDGYAYNYLFYECLTNPNLFEKKEGFVIHTDSRKQQFEEIMQAYGFNTEEINDFTEFWCEKLEAGKTYVMYPQMTDMVDNAMEIQIIPKPDSCIRMWFLFVECDDNMSVDEPKIQAFERNGYTVVEWGGMVRE